MASTEMTDDLDRYKQLLDDWDVRAGRSLSGGAAAEPTEAKRPRDTEDARAKLTRPGAEEPAGGRFAAGAILCLDDEELVVYRRPVAGRKNFDMVYSLLADGSVKIEGVELDQHEVAELGQLATSQLKQLKNSMVWHRELITANCAREEDAERIPDPGGGAPPVQVSPPPRPSTPPKSPPPPPVAPKPESPKPKPKSSQSPPTAKSEDGFRESISVLTEGEGAGRVEEPQPQGKIRIRRGQCVTVKFGDRLWVAIYWGRDKKGSVVAHKTHGHWALMHLDLNRFKDTMQVGPEPSQILVDEISADLDRKRKK